MRVSLARAILFIAAMAPPQLARSEIIELPFSMDVGDVFEMRVVEKVENFTAGAPERHETEKLRVFEVIEAGNNGYVVGLTKATTRTKPRSWLNDASAGDFIVDPNRSPVHFVLDIYGAPIELRKWRKLIEVFENTAGDVALAEFNGLRGEHLDAIIDMYLQMDSGRAAEIFGEDLLTWSIWQGAVIDTEQPTTWSGEMIAPMTGLPLASRGEAVVKEATRDRVVIAVSETFDPESLLVNSAAIIEKLADAPQSADNLRASAQAQEIGMSVTQVVVIDRLSGWARSVEDVQTITVGSATTRIRRKSISVARR